MTTLEHKTAQAVATTTDKGEFSALAAAYTVDRMKERIVPGAFEKTIQAWQESPKQIPLHWDHEASADSIIGSVDPATMHETAEGLYVEGRLDIKNSGTAREAWRSMKNNALSLSFGYLATKTREAKDVTELLEIDLFEISIVPAPANADTRVLSLKSALEQEKLSAVEDEGDEEPETVKSASQDPLRRRADALLLEVTGGELPKRRHVEPTPEPEPEPLDEGELRQRWDRLRLDIAGG